MKGCRDDIKFILALLLVMALFIGMAALRPNSKAPEQIRVGIEQMSAGLNPNPATYQPESWECAIQKVKHAAQQYPVDPLYRSCFGR